LSVSAPAPPDLLSAEHLDDPWPGLAVLREHYPVHYDETLETWLVSRYDDVRALNRRFGPSAAFQELLGQYLADAQVFPSMDGRDHRQRRALLAPIFARGGVESFHAHIENVARGLLDPVFERERQAVAAGERERGEMDFIKEFTARFSVKMMIDIMDLPIRDWDRMEQWFEAWIHAEGNIGRDPQIIERALWAKDDFGEFIRPIIAERRTSDGEDLVSRLCSAELDGFSLPDEEVQSAIAGLFLGGGETTDHQLGWLMHALIEHPEHQRALAEDRDLMTKVQGEGMRYCSIVQYLGRVLPEDIEVGGVRIEQGAPLALVLAAGNHDPRRFDRPDEFDPHRADLDAEKAFTGSADHLGFGTGAHFCIGSHLSKAEMDIAMNMFFDNARDVRFADGFEPHANPEATFVRALPELKITFDLV
jgi:cytochrome P450